MIPVSMDERAHLRNLLASAAEKRITQNVVSNVASNRNDINRIPECNALLPRLRAGSDHVLLVNHNICLGDVPLPYPESYVDQWDTSHIRLPCSPQNVNDNESIWERMKSRFVTPILTADDLEKTILSANPELNSEWSFKSLTTLLTNVADHEERESFFSIVLPNLIGLALQLPDICTQPIPLLVRHHTMSITLSQLQIGSLLANAFLCTFPGRSNNDCPEYRFYPSINFSQLYALNKGPRSRAKMEKIRCLINYFRRITAQVPTGLVTFYRRHLASFPSWLESSRPLRILLAQSDGSIEKDGVGLLQMDFANRRVGGGVLNTGCVQEEIRFVTFPELIVARLFTQCLDDSEVLLVTGCERYNSHSGYGDDFRWSGDYRDVIPIDEWNRRTTQVVAVDATRFTRPLEQYKPEKLLREINKLFCAFYEQGVDEQHLSAIATGNWGCGAYRGDPRLKALLQLLAASEASRDVVYYTFGDELLCTELNEMCSFLREKNVTVGSLWGILLRYHEEFVAKNNQFPLYQFIYKSLSSVENSDLVC